MNGTWHPSDFWERNSSSSHILLSHQYKTSERKRRTILSQVYNRKETKTMDLNEL